METRAIYHRVDGRAWADISVHCLSKHDADLEVIAPTDEERCGGWEPITEGHRKEYITEDEDGEECSYSATRDSSWRHHPGQLVKEAHEDVTAFMSARDVADLVPASAAHGRTGAPSFHGKFVE